MRRRRVSMGVCKGQPLDGSGRVAIHLFVKDEQSNHVEPHGLHPKFENGEQVKQAGVIGPMRGWIACDHNRNLVPTTRLGVTTVVPRTEDPRAITCKSCEATPEYRAAMDRYTKKQES